MGESARRRLGRRHFLRTAGVVAGGAWLAGCAPTQSAAPAKPAAAPTSVPAAQATSAAPAAAGRPAGSGQPLKIGVVLPFSGVYAVLGESIVNGMQLYFDSVNNTAGGRPITLIKEDEGTPEDALRKTRKLVEQDQIDVYSGLVSTASAYAVRDYVHENKVIFICSNAGGNDLTRARKSPYIFRASFSNAQPSIPMGEYLVKRGLRKVFVSAADYAAGKESLAAFKEGFLAAGGELVGETYPPFPNTDYAPFLTQIQQAQPQASYSFYAGSDAVNFVKQFSEFGLGRDIKLTGSGFLVEEDTLPAQGNSAIGAITGLHWALTLDNPENRQFTQAYRQKFNKDADVYAVQGHDAARVIVEAVNKTQGNTTDKDKLIDAIVSVKFASPRGPFEFDPDSHNVIHNIYAREVREVQGKLTNVVVETFPMVKDR